MIAAGGEVKRIFQMKKALIPTLTWEGENFEEICSHTI
jgi:hypothetical protein